MNDGVKILLERMKTHPEEFVDDGLLGATKWSGVLNYYDSVLTSEEKKAIQEGMLQIKRDAFTKQVMEMLIEEPVKIGTTADQMRALRRMPAGYQQTLTLQEQVDRIRIDNPFKPFIGEIK